MHIKPKKSLGQNFLIDKNIINKTVDELGISDEDFVLEIGPGEGALTDLILERAKKVICIELDQRACEVLENKFNKFIGSKLTIIHKDFLLFDFETDLPFEFKQQKIKILGNIPYYISGRIYFKLFQNYKFIKRAVLTVQKEVADRIVAKKNSKDYGILTVLANLTSQTKKSFEVSANCFYPKPNVTSAVTRIDFFEENPFEFDFNKTADIIKTSFNQRRKILSNNLKSVFQQYDVSEINIKKILELYGTKRAEQLEITDFILISKLCSKYD